MVYSKNKRAEELVGFRVKGTPIDLPCELDYNCPICHRHCKTCENKPGTLHDETLIFSEYNNFMWCPHCNVDIPWALCLRANTKQAIKIYTKRFLDMIQEQQKIGFELALKQKNKQSTEVPNSSQG